MSLNTMVVNKKTKEHRCCKSQYFPYYMCIGDNCETFERICYTKYLECLFISKIL